MNDKLFDEARRLHDIRSILGLPSHKKVFLCPLPMHVHYKNTPSFSVYFKDGVQRWRCHGSCNLDGDVIDLIGYMEVPGYNRFSRKHRWKALIALEGGDHPVSVVKPEKRSLLTGYEWRDFVPPGPEVIEYAAMRGLTRETIKHFNIGQCKDNMAIPCFEEYNLVGIKMRKINAKEKKLRYWSIKGSRQGLFNYDEVAYTTGVVFMVKGEIPAMLLWQYGFKVCAPTAGEGGHDQIEAWKRILSMATVIVVGDNDPAGVKLGARRADLMKAKLVFPASEYKDIDEWLLAKPEKALEQLEAWRNNARCFSKDMEI